MIVYRSALIPRKLPFPRKFLGDDIYVFMFVFYLGASLSTSTQVVQDELLSAYDVECISLGPKTSEAYLETFQQVDCCSHCTIFYLLIILII